MFKKYLFVIVVLFLSNLFAEGQNTIKSFSAKPENFINDMQTFLDETNKIEGDEVMLEFRAIWKPAVMDPKAEAKFYKDANAALLKRTSLGDSLSMEYSAGSRRLSDKQIEAVMKNCQKMLSKHMKAFPDFRNYIYSLISFVQTNQSEESFKGWQSSIDKLLEKTNKFFATYINICNGLFLRNTLYSSASTRWVSMSNNYQFDFDTLPKVIFPDLTLKDYAKGDSSIIYNTSGVYYPTLDIFYGKGGIVNWKRAGISSDTVWAELKNYTIKVTGDQFTADSVTFYNKFYFSKPMLGSITDKIQAAITPENASYPRFESYNKLIEIKQIVPGVDYQGGFSMSGAKMLGAGSKDQNAYLTIYYNNKPFFVAASQGFIVKPDKITSSNAAITMYYQKDSIYHPGLEFKFIVKDRELALIRNDEGSSRSPYYDSYHKIDMYFDALYWKIDDPVVQLKMLSASGEGKASFESSNFYREYRFRNIQALSDLHPFYYLKRYSERVRSREFMGADFAAFMKYGPDAVHPLLLSLAAGGYLTYDLNTDKIVLKDKMFFYLNSREGKTDYDVLQIESSILGKPNAKLSLLDFNLDINGVKNVFLSDSQNVFIFPKEQHITMLKNRDFKFAGVVKAGRFDFFGKEFYFDYDAFKIDLKNVDSLRLKVPADRPDDNGIVPLIPVKSVLQNITGDLMIDYPTNKSGLKDYPEYPIFNSKKDSYCYYDKPEIQKGVYHKDNFFFHLVPFTIDSLDNFTKEGLKFEGTFVSASIFPDFKDTLRLQPDYSLGFVRQTPTGGFPAYGSKATYFNTINLSNKGLRGDGNLNYLTSIAKSHEFFFYPDSSNTNAYQFIVKKEIYKGVEFPEVNAMNVYIHYMPYLDKEFVYGGGVPLDMYDGFSTFKGNYVNEPTGLTGSGLMAFSGAELEADLFHFKMNTVHCDTSAFRLKSTDSLTLAFDSKNVSADIDFIKKTGEFKSNNGTTPQKFPLNQYICYIDKFKWDMDKESMAFSSSNVSSRDTTNLEFAGSEFVSINPTQDSLRFRAPVAEFSLKDYVIRAHEVQNINVADAGITPDSGNVVIRRKAVLDPFKNAKIVANTVTKYHHLYNANVIINGRKYYSGSADYDYVDETKTRQAIHMDKISVDTSGQSYAIGTVTDTAFVLGPPFSYHGDVKLSASNEYLFFNGYSRLRFFNCGNMEASWFKFKGNINPTEIAIPIEHEEIDEGGTKLVSGIMLTKDSTIVYPAFLTPKKGGADEQVVSAYGFLAYDRASSEYRISNMDKLLNTNLPGNFLSLNTKTCELYGEGKLNLGGNFGQLDMSTVGNASYNINKKTLTMDLMMLVDFFFNEDALKLMTEQMAAITSLSPTTDNRPEFEQGLSELVGKEKAAKMISDMALYNSYKKFPDELKKPFFFTDMKMTYKPEFRSFRTTAPNGLGNVYKIQVNRMIGGTIEVVRKRSGDILNIYLEVDANTWYFFSYQRGILQAISSSEPFNKIIRDMKPEKRQAPAVKDKPAFQFMLSTERKKNDFLKKTADDDAGGDK